MTTARKETIRGVVTKLIQFHTNINKAYDVIKPLFDKLYDRNLLSKCLLGTNQNANDCLNKLIWDRCSKEYFVESDVVEEVVCSAIGHFNDGKITVVHMFGVLGIPAG